MRICFVGKYPPIQGGVAAQTYWAARGLAERGHQVFVVTNAGEVELDYRVRFEQEDAEWLTPAFPVTGGAVRVFRPEPYGHRMSHIPMGNPFASKLGGLATDVIRAYDVEVVVGSYLEPYGVAAQLAAGWTGRPVLLQHAGSDLDRLMRVPELAVAYKEILRRAAGVITRPGLVHRFLGMGLAREQILTGPPAFVPATFSPDATPLAAAEISGLAYSLPGMFRSPASFDPALPTIGMYGKPGEFKGTYDLLAAAGALRDGPDFNILLTCGPSAVQPLAEAISAAGLTERTWLLPFLPHWRVPSLIRACTAVAMLERDFPVVIHRPVVPREVLACGTCLLLSGEIHRKQYGIDGLADGETMLLVDDPKDHTLLAGAMRRVIEAPAAARDIGRRGSLLAGVRLGQESFIDNWTALTAGVLDGSSAAPLSMMTPAEFLDTRLPWLRQLSGDAFDTIFDGMPDPTEDSLATLEGLSRSLLTSADPVVRDAARYQLARCWTMRDDTGHQAPVPNGIREWWPSSHDMAARYPIRCASMRLERLDHDVTPLFCEAGEQGLALGPVQICFARLANLSPVELRINDATAALIERCDGRTTSAAIVADSTDGSAEQGDQAYVVLARLYSAGVLAFADKPGQSRCYS